MNDIKSRWPEDAAVCIKSRWRIKPGKEDCAPNGRPLKPETTALLVGAWVMENEIILFVNPAIHWQGTYQELMEYWEAVPDETPLTF